MYNRYRRLTAIMTLGLLAAFGCSKPEEATPAPSPGAVNSGIGAGAAPGSAAPMARMPAPTKIKE